MLGLTYGYRAKEGGNEDDWNESEASFRKYLEFNPTSPWARTDLSWVLFSEGKYEEMKPVLEEGLVHHPKHPWLLNMYGLALLNTGEHERAHAYFMDAYTYLRAYSAEDWGSAYPGNDPRIWGEGLDEMKKAVKHNLEITAKNSVHN